jgi:hypothetical protein
MTVVRVKVEAVARPSNLEPASYHDRSWACLQFNLAMVHNMSDCNLEIDDHIL